jgi:hypothetical protein
MVGHNDNLEGAAAIGFVAGVWIFFKGFREFRKYRVVADTPEIPIRSVPMGLVQIRGQAKGDERVTSPVSLTPCYWFRVLIEHWKTDSKGGGHWEHFRTDTDGVRFYLADQTGHVKVDAHDAELDLPQSARRELGHSLFSEKSSGPGATDDDLRRYVTRAGVHWIGGVIESGLQRVGPLSDPTKEEKRQVLVNAFQATPGTPEFMQKMLPFVAPMIKQRIESVGPQADPQHEQARQVILEAFNHQPGSPEFLAAVQRACAMGGTRPEAMKHFQAFLKPGNDLAMFQPASGRFRLTECCLVPEGTYDITGTCMENPSPADEHDRNLITKGHNEPTFLISSKTEKQLESSLRWRAVGKIFGGAALALVSAAVFLAKLGWLF